MTSIEFEMFCNRVVLIVRKHAPIKTGNLRYNAIRYFYTSPTSFAIYIDGEPPDIGIAPYAVFTNEKWTSPKWHGKQNPNEGWWQRAVEEIMQLIRQMGGKET